MDRIRCPQCGADIQIDAALEGQVEQRLRLELHTRHAQELEQAKQSALTAAQTQQALLLERLRGEQEDAKRTNVELRRELTGLNKALLEERRAKENAALAAAKQLREDAERIRQEALRTADELHRLKEQELQKQLADTKKLLDEAVRKAEQGSEQLQGEVLELELEALLRAEFPLDSVEEVRKGQRGADVRQTVRNPRGETCGLLLWESKNARWNKDWIAKLKDDVRASGANVGVIVSRELPEAARDMVCLEGVWVVRPRLAAPLASALRAAVLQVFAARRSAENQGEKMGRLYAFLTGVEFQNRIEAIVDNYNALQQEIEKEKRAAQIRWARQEKAIQAVIGNTYGLYGDLQGITGSELQIPLLEAAQEPEILTIQGAETL
jgi:hypothetical protein